MRDFYFEAPVGLRSGTNDAVWVKEDMPMLLHTFEYIARHAILNWRQAGADVAQTSAEAGADVAQTSAEATLDDA